MCLNMLNEKLSFLRCCNYAYCVYICSTDIDTFIITMKKYKNDMNNCSEAFCRIKRNLWDGTVNAKLSIPLKNVF